MNVRGADRLLGRFRSGLPVPALYAVLALLSFPSLETLRFGTAAPNYAHDVFDADGAVPRIGATLTQLRDLGPALWDPRIATGLPTLGHGSITPLAPDVLIGWITGPFVAYTVVAWLLAAAAGWGMHLFLRDSAGLPVAACLLGGAVYLFSFWHYAIGFAAVIAPTVMWAGDRLARSRRSRPAALLTGVLGVALGAYAGLGQVVVLVGGLHLAWALVGSTVPPRRGLMAWLTIWGLGLALYLPVLASQAVLLPVSTRTLWDLAYLYDSRLLPALANTVKLYSSILVGVPVGQGLGVSPAYYGTYFTGAVGIFFLGCAIALARGRPAGRFVLFALIAIPLIDWAYVVSAPNLDAVGVLKSFQVVRVRHLIPFVLAVGVAVGCARALALARLRPIRPAHRTAAAIGIAAAVLVAGQAAVAIHERGLAGGERWAGIGWTVMLVALVVGLAGLAIALVIGGSALQRGRLIRAAGGLAVVMLLLAGSERLLYAHAERLTGGQLGTWQDQMALTAAQTAIQQLGGPSPGRTLTMGDEPNRMAFHGLDQVDGYVAAYPRAHHDAFEALIRSCLDADPRIERYFMGWGQRFYAFCPAVDPEVLDLLGVRWISALGPQPTIPGLVERLHEGDLHLYENLDRFPRAFLVGGTEVVPDTVAAITRLSGADRATLEGSVVVVAGDATSDLPATPGPAGVATVIRSDADVVEIEAVATARAVLVLTDVVYPDWYVEVDGQAAKIIPVDVSSRGVVIPEGAHRVVFSYRPLATWVGFAAAAIAAALTAVLAAVLLRRERGHHRPRVS
jgi:Protein of unknown function (DUF6044)